MREPDANWRELLAELDLAQDLLAELAEEGLVDLDREPSALDAALLDELRVACLLMREFGVNVPGVAIILDMRRRMAEMHGQVHGLLRFLRDEIPRSDR